MERRPGEGEERRGGPPGGEGRRKPISVRTLLGETPPPPPARGEGPGGERVGGRRRGERPGGRRGTGPGGGRPGPRRPTPVRASLEELAGGPGGPPGPVAARRFTAEGAEWIARVAGHALAGGGPTSSPVVMAVRFFRSDEPERALLEVLTPGRSLDGLMEEELRSLHARARPVRERVPEEAGLREGRRGGRDVPSPSHEEVSGDA